MGYASRTKPLIRRRSRRWVIDKGMPTSGLLTRVLIGKCQRRFKTDTDFLQAAI